MLNAPAPLAGMRLPNSKTPWGALYTAGFRWVVCLCSKNPVYDSTPLKHLVKVELTDLVEQSFPEDPEMEKTGIDVISKLIVEKLQLGEGVIVHCAGGRGRTGAVLGVVSRKLGFSGSEIVEWLDKLHQSRGKSGWPESPWQKEIVMREGIG